MNNGLNSFETVKRWALLPEPLSVDNLQLTATLKKRRADIARVNAELIESLYAAPR